MTEIARRLLLTVPAVSLHVHEKNVPAVAAYKRAGFRSVLPFRLLRGAPFANGNGA
jgi:ribosomal protein S18 acetylase RimI-like enzyme